MAEYVNLRVYCRLEAAHSQQLLKANQEAPDSAPRAAKLEDLDTHTIQLFYNSLTKSGLAPKTVKNIHGVLHAALEQAISNGYIHKNPTAGCKLPKVVRPEIKPLEPEEIARMLKVA